jgi:putative IMPACT (imprinted ancient) family translation regulator
VLATVVRYFGGVKLGAGGLVRAYTDAVAQALLGADKRALRRTRTLACDVPYALEGLLRRELATAGAALLEVRHGSLVRVVFDTDEAGAEALRQRRGDATQGRAGWVDVD